MSRQSIQINQALRSVTVHEKKKTFVRKIFCLLIRWLTPTLVILVNDFTEMDGFKISKRSWPAAKSKFIKTMPDQDQGWTRHATITFNYSSSISLWPTLIVLGQIESKLKVINNSEKSIATITFSKEAEQFFLGLILEPLILIS